VFHAAGIAKTVSTTKVRKKLITAVHSQHPSSANILASHFGHSARTATSFYNYTSQTRASEQAVDLIKEVTGHHSSIQDKTPLDNNNNDVTSPSRDAAGSTVSSSNQDLIEHTNTTTMTDIACCSLKCHTNPTTGHARRTTWTDKNEKLLLSIFASAVLFCFVVS